MSETTETPGDVARKEAARQAVILVFGIAGALLLIAVQKRIHGGLLAVIDAEQARIDPAGAARRRMEDARARERRWGKAAVWLWRAGLLPPARRAAAAAERAHAEYEAARL